MKLHPFSGKSNPIFGNYQTANFERNGYFQKWIIHKFFLKVGISIRPPQNGATLYQNGAVPGRSRSFLERARPKIIFGTERPGTRNDRFRKKWERGKIFGTRSCPERGRSWVQAQHRNGIF